MNTQTQNQMILAALLKGDKLTPMSMLNRYGSLRASARIFNLRSKGYDIKTEIIPVSNGTKHVAQYHMEQSEIDRIFNNV